MSLIWLTLTERSLIDGADRGRWTEAGPTSPWDDRSRVLQSAGLARQPMPSQGLVTQPNTIDPKPSAR
jgi:hypothetical protein